jgi:hypothetical protein
MTDYATVLKCRYKGKEWTLDGDEYTGLTWLDDSPKPSKATLDGLWAEVQQEIADEKIAKAEAKASALAKLGLTADEAQALLG